MWEIPQPIERPFSVKNSSCVLRIKTYYELYRFIVVNYMSLVYFSLSTVHIKAKKDLKHLHNEYKHRLQGNEVVSCCCVL